MKVYLQMLIWMMLFVIVIEMIFPDSAYRKYLKLILGCIVVYTLLSPLIRIVQGETNVYDQYVRSYMAQLANSPGAIGSAYEEEVEAQKRQIKVHYQEGIKNLVESQFEVSVKSVNLDWKDEALNGIELIVGEKAEGKIAIGTIHIGDKSNTVNGEEENLKNKIKTCLSDFYNVQVCNIHITVQKK